LIDLPSCQGNELIHTGARYQDITHFARCVVFAVTATDAGQKKTTLTTAAEAVVAATIIAATIIAAAAVATTIVEAAAATIAPTPLEER
jgi:hypothetical protein